MQIVATIDKYDIMPLVKFHGMVNSKPFVVKGATCPTGSLVYNGFVGSHIGQRKYRGAHMFDLAPPQGGISKKNFDMNTLPGLAPVKTTKAVK